MAQNVGTLISAAIRPNNSLDPIASAYSNEIKGGVHSYNSATERDQIIIQRRQFGMLVYVISDQKTYQLTNLIDSDLMNNANWVEMTTSATNTSEWINSVLDVITIEPGILPTTNDRYLLGTASGITLNGVNWGSSPFVSTQVVEWDVISGSWKNTIPTNGMTLRNDNDNSVLYKYEGNYPLGYWRKERITDVFYIEPTTQNGLNYTVSTNPTFNYLDKNIIFLTKFSAVNTGPIFLNINGIGFKPVKKVGPLGLEDITGNTLRNDITYSLSFDGLNFQLSNAFNESKYIEYYVGPTETITIKEFEQYWVYGDLTIEGIVNNNGKIVVANGGVILQNDGELNNLGSGEVILVDLFNTPLYNNTTTIQFSKQLTMAGPSVSAIVRPNSLTASHLNTNTNGGATAGYILSNSGGYFRWIPNTTGMTGATGATGPQGIAGATGVGLVGPKGATGSVYATMSTNYVVKANGTYSLLNSQIYDDGTNIGIGTTSSTQKLEVIGNVKATSFIKTGGTSSEFLKADGSSDSTVYAIDSNVLHKTGDEGWTGLKSSSNTSNTQTNGLSLSNSGASINSTVLSILNSNLGSGIYITNITTGLSTGITIENLGKTALNILNMAGDGILLSNSGSDAGIYVTNTSNGIGYRIVTTTIGTGLNSTIQGSGNSIVSNGTTTATGYVYVGQNNGTNTFTVDKSGNMTASMYVVTGGLGTQFLKADGGLDSNTYALDSNVLHKSGDEVFSGIKASIYTNGSPGGFALTNNSTLGGTRSLGVANNSGSGDGVYVSNSSTGNGIYAINTGQGNAIYASTTNNQSGSKAIMAYNNATAGYAIYSQNNQNDGYSLYAIGTGINSSSIFSSSNGTGISILSVNNNVGYVYAGGEDENNIHFTVTGTGSVTATTFKITGGLSSQFLKADGSLDNRIFELQSNKNVANGYAGLDANNKIYSYQLPAIAITDTYVVSSQAAMLGLTAAETGDVAVRTDISKSFILRGSNYSLLTDWQELLTPTDTVTSVFGRTGVVVAANGDYNTGLVTEVTNKNYQTDNQKLYNDATSSIQTQLNTKLSGNGTANYLSKYTGSTTMAISQVYDNGTNVMVGTTTDTPGYKLQVNGSLLVAPLVNTSGMLSDLLAVTNLPTGGVPDAYIAKIRGHNGTTSNVTTGLYVTMENNKNAGLSCENTNTMADVTNSFGVDILFKDTSTTNTIIRGRRGSNNVVFNVSDLGDTTANKFIKIGGTITQFLKADGSVDSTVYAPLASPGFTGIPTAPTATVGTNTTQIATTAFVLANAGGIDTSALHQTGNESFTGNKSVINTGSSQTSGILGTNNGGAGSSVIFLTNNVASSSASALRVTNNDVGYGVLVTNANGGSGFGITGLGAGDNVVAIMGSTASGYNYVGKSGSTNTFTVNKAGDIYSAGNILAVGNVTAGSDERIKTNIRPLENSLSKVLNITGFKFDRTDNELKDQIGFIAQNLEKEFPELVTTSDLTGMKSVNYQNMTAVLVECIKTLKQEIEDLKKNIK